MEESFWQRPPRWLWLLLFFSLALLGCSLSIWREGLRYQSRELTEEERKIVFQALEDWESFAVEAERVHALREYVRMKKIRAMDESCFFRAKERVTFGYTDEHRRILLNPNFCFSSRVFLGPRAAGVSLSDRVRTMATLYHEHLHLYERLAEDEACRREWRFVRQCREQSRDPQMKEQLQRWEQGMPERLEALAEKPPPRGNYQSGLD